ncbi:hypothetical protein MAMT_00972 [Methylacidimicrobium tartarophylax]|uniref:Uncharacterized protein n=1 Tax=Methylacidimicrobium tartarophylax TaxID=1041768 RepID=A0A5E6M964_9BACT|nr:hypothetical protein MAMT_00972 [Methylacidimicrobium tartarophylax]
MTTESLAQSCLRKAEARLGFLAHLLESRDYSDVIREAQEAVEVTPMVRGIAAGHGIKRAIVKRQMLGRRRPGFDG